MSYRVTKLAERDLDEIFVYWATRASLEAADRIIDGIMGRFWLLGEHPDAGRRMDDVAGVKCFPAGKYLIYYRASSRGTDILHVLHGVRDQARVFKPAKKPR
jgi:toxin ParE1/3/4